MVIVNKLSQSFCLGQKCFAHSVNAVYGCGLAASGSLLIKSLLKNSIARVEKPRRINFFNVKDIEHIAAGFGFSVFASKQNVFGGGVNIFSNEKPEGFSWTIGHRILDLKKKKIISLSAGRRHFLVATKGRVFAFGDNSHGQCGFDPEKYPFLIPNEENMQAISIPSKSEIRQVHCTLDTSFVLLNSGELFSFGLGTDGQLGRGVKPYDWQCLPVENFPKDELPIEISGSTDTLMSITRSGKLFMWGQNEYGQIHPFSFEMQVGSPQEIRFSIGNIASASSTATSCIVSTTEGEVYVWGFGVVGQGPNIVQLNRPSLLESNLFSGNSNDDGFVSKVFAGNTSMFALTKSGNLFAWGINRFSHLGLGHSNDQFFPFQVFLIRKPKDLSVAPDHLLILA